MKKHKSAKTKKLTLTKESLRELTLTRDQLAGVAGGGWEGNSGVLGPSYGTIVSNGQ